MVNATKNEGSDTGGVLSLNSRQAIWLNLSSVFFAVLPSKVFIEISSDIIQVSVIAIACIAAFMTIFLTIDTTFGLSIPANALQRISYRYNSFSTKLQELLRYSVALLVLTIIAKSLVLWFTDYHSTIALVARHFIALSDGATAAMLLIKFQVVQDMFGYLAVGADIARSVRIMKGAQQPPTE